MNVLSLHDAGIRIGRHWLVRHADLSLRHGHLTALVGPNGSGKSTLLRLACGLWRPSEGQVQIDGNRLDGLTARQIARRIAVVPQEVRLNYDFTVREVVAMGRYPHEHRLGRPRARDRIVIEQAMDRTDIADLADRFVTQLSGGERQRVLLARCLATEADIVLLDEPTANLDLSHALDVLGLCRGLAEGGAAVAMAIHNLDAAMRYADEVVVLSEGRVAAAGSAGEVLTAQRIEEVFRVRAEPVRSSDGTAGFIFSPRNGDTSPSSP